MKIRTKSGILSMYGHISSECKCWLEITLMQLNLKSGRVFVEEVLLAACITYYCHPQWTPFHSNAAALKLLIKDYTGNYSVLKHF